MHIDLISYFFLFFVAIIAGLVDAVAGGGGLLTLPSMLALGFPPQVAIGTNKFQAFFGITTASHKYYKNKMFTFHSLPLGLSCVTIGAVFGALTTQNISSVYLQKAIPFLLTFIFLYTLFFPKVGVDDTPHKISHALFYTVFGLLLGFYDGFFGPGTGSFWTSALIYFLGFSLQKATVYSKVLNLQSNLVSVLCFMFMSSVNYQIGFVMACGAIIGGRLGATLVIKKGAVFIRPLFLTMVFLTLSTLFYKSYFK